MAASEEEWARVRAHTHVFQNIRPVNTQAAAICARCGLVLPSGPILSIGPEGLPPCSGPRSMHDGQQP